MYLTHHEHHVHKKKKAKTWSTVLSGKVKIMEEADAEGRTKRECGRWFPRLASRASQLFDFGFARSLKSTLRRRTESDFADIGVDFSNLAPRVLFLRRRCCEEVQRRNYGTTRGVTSLF